MMRDDCGPLGARVSPDFVAAFALTPKLTAQRPKLAHELLVGHAGTMRAICIGI